MNLDPEVAKMLGLDPAPPPTATIQQSSDPLAFLNGIGKEEPKGAKRKSYPIYPDPDGSAARIARRIIELADAKDELETCNKMLGEMTTPFYFTHAAGKPEVESSVKVSGGNGNILVTFKEQVKKMKDATSIAPVAHIFNGREKEMFFHSFDLKIDSDEIPSANQPAFVAELTQLMARHGANPQKALKVERQFKPLPAFWSQRHLMFSAAQNLEINRTMPVIVAVKTKGVT